MACKMFYFIFVVNYKVVDLLVFFQIPQELAQSNICAKSYGKKKIPRLPQIFPSWILSKLALNKILSCLSYFHTSLTC